MYAPEFLENEQIRSKITRLNYLLLLIIVLWIFFLAAILTFSPGAYLVAFFVTVFLFAPLIIFIAYRVSSLRHKLNSVTPAPQPVPVVVYAHPPQPVSPVTYPLYQEQHSDMKAY